MIAETGMTAAVCIIGAVLACLLKQYCKEQALFCSIGVCVLVLLSICAYLSPIAEQIQALFLKQSWTCSIWNCSGNPLVSVT